MGHKCCVPYCRGNYKSEEGMKVHVFQFPRCVELRNRWIAAIRRDDFIPTRNSRVCHRHFTESDICRYTQYYDEKRDRTITVKLRRIRLREDAVPSVFECWGNAIIRKSAVKGTVHDCNFYRSDHNYAKPYPPRLRENCEDVANSNPMTHNISSWSGGRNQIAAERLTEKVAQCGSRTVLCYFTRTDDNTVPARKSRADDGFCTCDSCTSQVGKPAGSLLPWRLSYSQYNCAVFHCVTNAQKMPGVVCHSFPKDERLRREWIAQCKRPDKVNMKTARVCSIHFRPEDYERDLRNELLGLPLRKKLVPTAIPSLHIPSWDEDELFMLWTACRKKGGRKRKKLRESDDDGGDNVGATVHEMLEKGDNKRKKLPQREDDGGDNGDSILHQMLAKPQEVMINEEIIVKQEVQSDIDDLVDAGRQQDPEYVPVKEEPTEDPDESTCSAAEETREQMGHAQELPLIIKEEIDCDNYVDPFHIPQEAYLQ